MKKGDFIFYFGQDGGTISGQVVRVGASGKYLAVHLDRSKSTLLVKSDNCQLQTEWAKENGIEL